MVDWKKGYSVCFVFPLGSGGAYAGLCGACSGSQGEELAVPEAAGSGLPGTLGFCPGGVLVDGPHGRHGVRLLFHWLLLPIAAFVISLRIGELVRRDGRMWLLPLALGLLYMLADFLTFRLANMLAFDKINLPQWDLFFIGAAISALGLLIGRLLGRRRSKPA